MLVDLENKAHSVLVQEYISGIINAHSENKRYNDLYGPIHTFKVIQTAKQWEQMTELGKGLNS